MGVLGASRVTGLEPLGGELYDLLVWPPFILLQSPEALDEFTWYSSLHEYSQPQDDDEEVESEPSPDGDLVSAMMSTAVVPRICKMLEAGAFDPYSVPNIRKMIDTAEQVEASIGSDHHKFLVCSFSVCLRFHF